MSSNQIDFWGNEINYCKKEKIKTIISASRRTDIPAFYYEWLQNALKNKEAEITNPMFPTKKYKVDLSPENVHSIVLWSKNFIKVAKNPGLLSDYNLYFQYTINSYSRLLEPNVPDYKTTISTLELLQKRYRPEQFNIRFDPVIISRNKGEIIATPECPQKARLNAFEQLCKDIVSLGLNKCKVTTSYISLYKHVQKKIDKCGIDIIYLNENQQLDFFREMAEIAYKYNIKLYSCADTLLENVSGINQGCCIDGGLLVSLFGGKVSGQKDKSQRQECGCTKSKDIGIYSNSGNGMRCQHNCIYCYIR